jgi:phosphoglucosamine mutase
VLDELIKRDGSLGGEQSGHIIIPELSLAGDGMITSLCLLRAMAESGSTLSRLTAEFKKYPQILVNVRVKEKVPFEDIPSVQKVATEVEERLSHNGRLLLRYSGTELLARVMMEGPNQTAIETDANRIAEAIRQAIGDAT